VPLYQELVRRSRELAVVQSVAGVLQWDQQTFMPAKAATLRGEQLAALATLAHSKATDPAVGEAIAGCLGQFPADSVEAADAREAKRAYDRATKLPARLVEELARVTTEAHEVWVAARKANDFPAFRPWLEKIVTLKREEADAVGFAGHRYDALLDEYEPGCTAAELTPLFAGLVAEQVPLVRQIVESGRSPDRTILERDYPVERQKLFGEAAAAAVGFDFAAGRLDIAAHPFCAGFGPGDCRLTTRYHPNRFPDAFFGVLHEAGHGMYEQGLPADRFGYPAGAYCSLGIHESQSRLWENAVGRSEAFWRHFFPRLRQAFPGTLAGVTPEAFRFAINDVKPSLIRVEADEATYNLHVAVRFELELALISGELPVADVPGAWREKYRHYLGVTPPDDRDGCLQDVHWSGGGIGYFPTYTLGNLYAAQLMEAARRQLGGDTLDASFAAGNFAPLLDWLRANVHIHGRRYTAGELCRRATGEDLTPRHFLRYLKDKFAPLYSL
jgi:carboxypeptidase Taq